MRLKQLFRAAGVTGLALAIQIAASRIQLAQQPAPQTAAGAQAAPQAGRGGGPRGGVDPRVQQRTYTFPDTGEQMPYAVFVSSKVSKDKKNPLILALHGLGGDQNTMVRETYHAVELAEEGGYILVAPMGYNSGGWYGIPVGAPRGGGGARAGNGAPANGPPPAAAARGGGRGPAAVIGGTAITDAAKVREASEKDTMLVLDMIRKEFNIDEHRTYLMGHSMGGAGTYYLGSKYANQWAAIAPIAPASMGMNNDRGKILQGIKDAGVPMLVVQGDADEAVPVANTRMWVDTMKELNMNFEYKEVPGAMHGPIIGIGMPDVFAFFNKHTKPASR
jgi:predicted esterase